MADTSKTLTGLEQKRLQLEKQVTDLQNSIYHWRLWNAEYDGLKEELSGLPDNSTREDILQVGINFGGSQVTEKEVRTLLGEGPSGTTISRSLEQIISAIGRRVDYVLDNIKALEKRATILENKLSALLVIEQPDAGLNEDGLPITDIIEELDEEGNVISSSTKMPGKETGDLLSVLEKAGLGVPGEQAKSDATKGGLDPTRIAPATSTTKTIPENKSEPYKSIVKTSQRTAFDEKQIGNETSNKGVQIPSNKKAASSQLNYPTVGQIDVPEDSVTPARKDVETDCAPIVVEDDSPEDAALRRDMLKYGLEEVGAIVSELELDEDGSEFSVDDEDYDLGDENSEDEDEYGRSTRKVLEHDYIKQMRELEKKLNAKSLQNIGPDPSSLPSDVQDQLEQGASSIKKSLTKKKKVAFADELDIAPDTSPKPVPPTADKTENLAPTMQDVVVERSGSTKEKIPDTNSKRKPSRFKRNLAAEDGVPLKPANQGISMSSNIGFFPDSRAPVNPLPLFPATPSTPKPFSQTISDPDNLPISNGNKAGTETSNKPVADVLVERAIRTGSIIPPDSDELDEAIHRREVAAEFYKLRNQKIQQNGGFLQEDEVESLVPINFEENIHDGQDKPKKVSRFMAARAK